MATAGHFVRERIPVPIGVADTARLVREVVEGSYDTQAESIGPMTFKLVRRYRPNWATMTGFLIFPLFVRNSESCRLAVIEAANGSELLLEGMIDNDLHDHLVQLGRVPEAARVSTLGPRPVPQAISGQNQPRAEAAPVNGSPARRADPFAPPSNASIPAAIQRNATDEERLPTLLPREGDLSAASANGSMRPHAPEAPWAEQSPAMSNGAAAAVSRPFGDNADYERQESFAARPESSATSLLDGTRRDVPVSRSPLEPSLQMRMTIDTGEEARVPALLIIGRAPSRGPGEEHAELLTVNDPSLSVSKSHLAVELDGTELWITDRNSTNGSWIDEGRGALRPVPPHQRTKVPHGARVLIGERILTFSQY